MLDKLHGARVDKEAMKAYVWVFDFTTIIM